MPITFDECAPYLSTALLRCENRNVPTSDSIAKSIKKLFGKKDANQVPLFENRKVQSVTQGPSEGSTSFTIIHYIEKKKPGWYLGSNSRIVDTSHNIIVVGVQDSITSLTFTDSAMRNRVISNLLKSEDAVLKKLKKLTIREMEKIFVEGKVRTLWLTGAHRRSLIKPDAKVISGLELESALDPLGDQSYFFSSVRSTFTENGFTVDGKPLSDGLAFSPSIPVLAQSTTDLTGLGSPYGISLIVPEQLIPDSGDNDEGWFQLFSDTAYFEVIPSTSNNIFNIEVSWGGSVFGEIKYELSTGASGNVKLTSSTERWINTDEDLQAKQILHILSRPDHLTVYFDSGHTLSRGRTNVKKEKPLDGRRFDIEAIGDEGDDSLFGLMARDYPNLEAPGNPQGWLVCDDGAMESADFIYFDDTAGQERLELIHVKGSNSDAANRGLSVSDYEIVVGQAVKNLRHIDRNSLVEKLRANKDNLIGSAVWKDGVRQENRDDFLIALNSVTSDIQKTVVVFQPRVRKSIWDHTVAADQDNNVSRRLKQLDALLLGARSSCFDLGARFVVIADAT